MSILFYFYFFSNFYFLIYYFIKIEALFITFAFRAFILIYGNVTVPAFNATYERVERVS